MSSTNDVARELAGDGAAAGLVVIADHQTAGRGRMGRAWLDRPGTALLLSVLIRPATATAPGTAPLRAGMAVATALRSVSTADLGIKWPNDLVVARGKVGGILCEGSGAGTPDGYVIVGVGINVHACPPVEDDDGGPSERVALPPSSLDDCTGFRHDRSVVADAVVRALQQLRTASLGSLTTAELERFASLDALRDRPVMIDGDAAGHVARGIDHTGALIVELNQTRRRITSATVRPTPTAEAV